MSGQDMRTLMEMANLNNHVEQLIDIYRSKMWGNPMFVSKFPELDDDTLFDAIHEHITNIYGEYNKEAATTLKSMVQQKYKIFG